MNVSFKNIDAVSGILRLEIEKNDYATTLERRLRNQRQKVNVPGFRTGMAPMELVRKMYGKYLLIEEVNSLARENLNQYIRENDIQIIGEPLPNETEQPEIDFATQENFVFCFDLALAPALHVELTKNDKLTRYELAVDDKMIDDQIESYRRNYGSYDSVAGPVEANDLLKGVLAELKDGEPTPDGILVEEAVLMPRYIKNEEEQARFIGAASNSVIVFNPHRAYDGALPELSSLLRISREAAAENTNDFRFEIKEITRHQPAELDQALFDRVFGEGTVTTIEAFREKVKEVLLAQFAPQSDYKFMLDLRALLTNKVGEVQYADALLKRWLAAANEKTTPEEIEADYPKVTADLTYHLLKERLLKENNLTIEEADIQQASREITRLQFMQYGMPFVPDDILDNYSKDMLRNKKGSMQEVLNRATDNKLMAWANEQVNVETQAVTYDEFNRLFAE